MPRIILKRRPSASTDSPGLSSVPASIEPIITRGRAGRERLHHVARVLDAAVGDDRHVVGAAHGVHDRGDLGDAHAGDDARGADAARPDADLHRVHPAAHHLPRARLGGDVAGDELHVGERLPQLGHGRAARLRCGRAPSPPRARPRRRRPARGRAPVASEPPPTAAATRSRPCWSLLALGCSRRLKMSLTVIRPLSTPWRPPPAASRSGAAPGSARRRRGWCRPAR